VLQVAVNGLAVMEEYVVNFKDELAVSYAVDVQENSGVDSAKTVSFQFFNEFPIAEYS
jgi:hypothetical protein